MTIKLTSQKNTYNTSVDSPSAVSTPENAAQVGERIKFLLQKYLIEERHDFIESIDNGMSFDYIGLDSLARVNLLVGLEKEFGVPLDPTAAYDFVTVQALADFVWSVVSSTPMDIKKVLAI
ncbi:acyl carrier protein [Deefgea rivuli]|uniref:acyl carrier protein n=1 Tax=Deefgea rivuli TaxID=400948 RepID=UPI000569FD6C|nr:acyl carrier protein [Deefgea rivuli]